MNRKPNNHIADLVGQKIIFFRKMAYSSYDGVPSKMFYIYVGFEVMTAVVMKS